MRKLLLPCLMAVTAATLPVVPASASPVSTGLASVAGARSAAPGLAKAVAQATTTKARVAAIDKIMAALNFDVINPADGAVVVPGAARSLNDDYLYSNEVQRLALGYGRRQRFTLAQLAGYLGALYSKLGVRLTAASMGAAVLKVTKADATNAEPDAVALLPRLVWQLGLRDKPAQDLAGKIAVSRIRFDALAAWLVVAAFTVPLVYANPVPAHAASRLPAQTDGVVKGTTLVPADFCDELKPFKKILTGTAQYVETAVLTALGKAGWAAVLKTAGMYLAPLIDIIHELITGIGVVVKMSVSPAVTYLSGGPDMNFAVNVFMIIHLHPVLVRCGWLLGDVFPGYGPVRGVDVHWDNSELTPWGTITCDRVGCDKTGTDGAARETFTPGQEEVHRGTQIHERGLVHAITFVASSLGNKVIGVLGDLLSTLPERNAAWEVRHHNTGFPTGFTADVHLVDYQLVNADLKLEAVRHPAFTGDCTTAAQACTYKVQQITGNASEGQCSATIPPFNTVTENITITEWPRPGGQKLYWANNFQLSFTTGPATCPPGTTGGGRYEISVWNADGNHPPPPYEFGEIQSTENLVYGNPGSTMTITWQY